MNTHKLKEKCSFLYNHSTPLGHYITFYPLIVASHFLFPVIFGLVIASTKKPALQRYNLMARDVEQRTVETEPLGILIEVEYH